MPLTHFACTDFRCLRAAEFVPHPEFTLIAGPNAAGKTSLLEAIGCLGRGRSFRGAGPRDLVRHGAESFVVRGTAERHGREHRLGLANGRGGLELRLDGQPASGLAELAAILPLQVIDPEIHDLVGGAPEQRRRFVDWMTFHVEHGYVEAWRRFRRALKQRNAVLRQGGGGLDGWDEELARTGEAVDAARGRVLERAIGLLESAAAGLLGAEVAFEYRRGWPADAGLRESLVANRERDRAQGGTLSGPHRADLALRVDDRLAKRLVSRGQQKLLACAMVLGSVRVVREPLGYTPLLLLDDPAAELDQAALGRLMSAVRALDGQVIATALTPDAVPLPEARALFHVEHGDLRPA